MADPDALKRAAGEAAVAEVKDGMVVGLGTGSTVRYTIEALARRVTGGLEMQGIPTSHATELLAHKLGIKLTTLDDHPDVDVTIDGADEIDPKLRLIKGGGGALTREKVVATASRRMVVVADSGKEVRELGTTFPLPVEVLALAQAPVRRLLESLGARASVRAGPTGKPFITDNGNPILDARFERIADPEGLEAKLNAAPGVVCCGLFLGLCDIAYIARPSGVVQLRPP